MSFSSVVLGGGGGGVGERGRREEKGGRGRGFDCLFFFLLLFFTSVHLFGGEGGRISMGNASGSPFLMGVYEYCKGCFGVLVDFVDSWICRKYVDTAAATATTHACIVW